MAYTKANVETAAPAPKKEHTLEEVRKNANIRIRLPLVGGGEDSMNEDVCEYVTINGTTTQIRKGEVVAVPYPIFEAIYNSGRYNGQNILA